MRRAVILVLDGVGIGEAPDAAAYGDAGSNTLGNIAAVEGGLRLPNLQKAGLGCIAPLAGVPPVDAPSAAYGMLVPASAGKDSTAGHWELAGLHLARPFPVYPDGFPAELIREFSRRAGRAVLGNLSASGTEVLSRFGAEHQRTGAVIVYTSADSVFQVAAHEDTIPLEELYRLCGIARELLVAPHDVSRVIARPFAGTPGHYARTANRRDFSIEPPEPTLLDALAAEGVPRDGVGKVDDLFARRAIRSVHTTDNADGIRRIRGWLERAERGLLFANLVDFDQQFGHRNDVSGFHNALRQFDAALPSMLGALREDDLLFLTADHGNDPTTESTDHARECVPLLVAGPRVRPRDLGRRTTLSDVGATAAEWLGSSYRGRGTSLLGAIVRG